MKAKSMMMVLCALLYTSLSNAQADLIMTAVFDGPLDGGNPKGLELYVKNDIPDLSIYGLGSANYGEGTDGIEFTFPSVAATQGDYIYVAFESVQFQNFFGFAPDYTTSMANISGYDAIELYQNGTVVDTYGELIYESGTESNLEWSYLDSWAYRVNGTDTSADFDMGNWVIVGSDALDDELTNATSSTAIPIGSYSPLSVPSIYTSPGEITEIDSSILTGNAVVRTMKVMGSNLSDDIIVTIDPTSDFRISADGISFSNNSITLTQSSGKYEGEIYLKIKGDLSLGDYSDQITFSTTDLSDLIIDLHGSVYQYTQKFISSLDDYTQYSLAGVNEWFFENIGNPKGCALMNGYNNNDWLISPSIDLSSLTSPTLSFESVKNNSPLALKVYISEDYVSGSPSTATWYEITNLFTYPSANGWNNWTNSGESDISGMIGNNVHIAFRYTSVNNSGSWGVDNIIITEDSNPAENIAPVINTVATNPLSPSSSQSVIVAGMATDADGVITKATVTWGTSAESLSNTISMTITSGSVLTASSAIPAQSAETVIYYQVEVEDNGGLTTQSSVLSYTVASSLTIPQIQGMTDYSPYEGNYVRTSGIVTRVTMSEGSQDGFFLQDGIGAWTGIYVYTGNANTTDVTEGDVVTVAGTIFEENGQTRFDGDLVVQINGTGVVPTATLIIGELEEKDESVLSVVAYAIMASSAQDGNGVLELTIGGMSEVSIFMDDLYYDFTTPVVDGYYSIEAPVDHNTTLGAYVYRMAPTQASDIIYHSDVATQIDDIATEASIYSNENNVYVKDTEDKIEIYNLAGKMVYNGYGNSTTKVIQITTPGVYIVQVGEGELKRSRKVLIQE